MEDYYLEGEERFGPITSLLYWLGTRLPGMKKFYSFILDDLKDEKFTEILDVGTGPGYIPAMLARAGINNMYAIDPSINMINIAKSNSKGLKIKYGIGSSRNIPFKRKFSLIITTLSFHHWAQKAQSLHYLSHFLKRGGEIRVYEFERKERKGLSKYLLSTHSVTKKQMIDVGKKSHLKLKGIICKSGCIRVTFAK